MTIYEDPTPLLLVLLLFLIATLLFPDYPDDKSGD